MLHRLDNAGTSLAGAAVNVLDDDHRIVDDQADRHRQPAQRHEVDGAAEQPEEYKGRNDRHRQCHRRDQRQPPVAQEDQQHDDGEEAADQNGIADVRDRFFDELGQIVDPCNTDPCRQDVSEPIEHTIDAGFERQNVGADLLRDRHHDRVAAVPGHEHRAIRSAGRHHPEICDAECRAVDGPDRRLRDLIRVGPQARRQRQVLQSRFRESSDRLNGVLGLQGICDIDHRQIRGGQLGRVEHDLDFARVTRLDVDDAGARDAGHFGFDDEICVVVQLRH